MSRNSFIIYSLCAMAIIVLNGCAKTREAFGLNRHQPDEFTTPSRPPLEKPKNSELVLPKKGAATRSHIKDHQQVSKIVAGDVKSENKCPEISASEKDLMKEMKAEQASPDIRDKIDQSTAPEYYQNESVVKKLLFWQKNKPAGDILDPKKELAHFHQHYNKTE